MPFDFMVLSPHSVSPSSSLGGKRRLPALYKLWLHVTCVYIFRSPLVRQKNLKYFDVSLLEFFNLRLVYWPQISRSTPYRSEVRLRCMYALAKEFSVSRTDRCMWGYRYFEERANSGLFLTAWKMQRNIHAAIQLNVYVFLISSQNNPM